MQARYPLDEVEELLYRTLLKFLSDGIVKPLFDIGRSAYIAAYSLTLSEPLKTSVLQVAKNKFVDGVVSTSLWAVPAGLISVFGFKPVVAAVAFASSGAGIAVAIHKIIAKKAAQVQQTEMSSTAQIFSRSPQLVRTASPVENDVEPNAEEAAAVPSLPKDPVQSQPELHALPGIRR